MDLQTFVTTFLGAGFLGGLVVALLDWWRTSSSEARQREISFLDKQIRELYGPLYFLVSQSERLFELYGQIHNAYKKEYIEPKFSEDDNIKRVLSEETNKI